MINENDIENLEVAVAVAETALTKLSNLVEESFPGYLELETTRLDKNSLSAAETIELAKLIVRFER